MDRVLFGDNQFFGVNHMSEEKARAQSMKFQDMQAQRQTLQMHLYRLLNHYTEFLWHWRIDRSQVVVVF